MGIEYYLVNRKNKTYYDLSKGGWINLDLEDCSFGDPELLLDSFLEDEIFYKQCYSHEEWSDMYHYIADRIIPDLIEFCKDTTHEDLKIINDCGDLPALIRSKGYICTGTRFYDKGSEKHSETITHENTYWKNGPSNWNDPEYWRGLPEFDWF